MQTWNVQLWQDGQYLPYQKVVAATAKEAAEHLYGRPLSEVGSNHQFRAQVRQLPPIGQGISPTVFYERS